MRTTRQTEAAAEYRATADAYRPTRDQYLAEASAAKTAHERRDLLASAEEYAGYVSGYTYNALEAEGLTGAQIDASSEYALASAIREAIETAYQAAYREARRDQGDREVRRALRALRTEQHPTEREILFEELADAYAYSSAPQHEAAARATAERLCRVRLYLASRAA